MTVTGIELFPQISFEERNYVETSYQMYYEYCLLKYFKLHYFGLSNANLTVQNIKREVDIYYTD